MKVLMIFDQTQAGLGGKENPNLELGGKMMPIGSASMLEPALKEVDGKVVATLYCGDGFFDENKQEVTKKIIAMTQKINPDVIICGPAYNYKGYAKMCAVLAKALNRYTKIPAIAAMSQENDETIAEYKDVINIVKMPKKGGTGLNDSLRNICRLAKKKANGEDVTEYAKQICY
ncbi:GrdB-related putative oxidoreductase [Clostridium disporicum]|uniref:Glycine/sarcosine/betaine reductase selenoprotein B (GRDB) n=1 Tax=Clostridium disporicum TaxID=84024 RepID=A0A174C3P9_9CLOT|nr:GrdB-related putative oxidoreductase [Clostridium disporicum]MDY3360072.1 GrdB-related putative oxidoreductase [Clostridium celatum]CUO07764.1 Glycine/sarcosine/betaine reductase selenoprotein B (GRDB) [Clostridium disporicum]